MKNRRENLPILLISVAIPLGVALLFVVPHPHVEPGFNLQALPLFHAILNSTTFFLLLASFYFIRRGRRRAHATCNLTAVGLSVIFLISYVTYHYLSPQAHYGGTGAWRAVYFFILITHILLSAVIVPLVLITLLRALRGNFPRHKKIARITWPLWLYVTLSGVVVYIMMAPYY